MQEMLKYCFISNVNVLHMIKIKSIENICISCSFVSNQEKVFNFYSDIGGKE